MDDRIDFSRYRDGAYQEEVSRHKHPERETRPQPEKERAPDYFQRTRERDGVSEWSGGRMGGGVWAGRSR
jgi:hypothetical protein